MSKLSYRKQVISSICIREICFCFVREINMRDNTSNEIRSNRNHLIILTCSNPLTLFESLLRSSRRGNLLLRALHALSIGDAFNSTDLKLVWRVIFLTGNRQWNLSTEIQRASIYNIPVFNLLLISSHLFMRAMIDRMW